MTLALACAPLSSVPLAWFVMFYSLDWRVVIVLLLAMIVCISLGIPIMREIYDMPTKQRREMRFWVIVQCVFLGIAVCGLIVSVQDAMNMAQAKQPDSIGMVVTLCALICVDLPARRVRAIHNAYKPTHRPNIPPVPDSLAARRAIVRRPYRRGLIRSRWR